MSDGCCLLTAEILDDARVAIQVAAERYRYHSTSSTGHNAGAAAAILEVQSGHRQPAIEEKRAAACGTPRPPSYLLAKTELARISQMIAQRRPYGAVYAAAQEADVKLAQRAYREYCGCRAKP